MPLLTGAVGQVPRVLADPAPSVLLSSFGADGLDLTLPFWIADPQNGQGNVLSMVNLEILRVLNGQGIDIPFPQRTLHAGSGFQAALSDADRGSPSAPP
jgi:small-conductance mechanosensitive channel